MTYPKLSCIVSIAVAQVILNKNNFSHLLPTRPLYCYYVIYFIDQSYSRNFDLRIVHFKNYRRPLNFLCPYSDQNSMRIACTRTIIRCLSFLFSLFHFVNSYKTLYVVRPIVIIFSWRKYVGNVLNKNAKNGNWKQNNY